MPITLPTGHLHQFSRPRASRVRTKLERMCTFGQDRPVVGIAWRSAGPRACPGQRPGNGRPRPRQGGNRSNGRRGGGPGRVAGRWWGVSCVSRKALTPAGKGRRQICGGIAPWSSLSDTLEAFRVTQAGFGRRATRLQGRPTWGTSVGLGREATRTPGQGRPNRPGSPLAGARPA